MKLVYFDFSLDGALELPAAALPDFSLDWPPALDEGALELPADAPLDFSAEAPADALPDLSLDALAEAEPPPLTPSAAMVF